LRRRNARRILCRARPAIPRLVPEANCCARWATAGADEAHAKTAIVACARRAHGRLAAPLLPSGAAAINMAPADEATAPRASWQLLVALGVTQIVSWGSVYYAFALLLEPLQRDLGAGRSEIAGAFSVALLVSGLFATWIGRTIDRLGGRGVMTLGSLAAALLLAALSQVQSVAMLYALWAGLGAVMAATLYEPAFVVVAQVFRSGYRRALTVLTLFGGLASTVFWPLTTILIERFGWRDALLWLAAINLVVCVPLHFALLPRSSGVPMAPMPARGPARPLRLWADRRFRALALAFLAHYIVVSAIAAHLIALLLARGLSPAAAAGIGALIGPMQVAGRLVEFGASRWLRVDQVGRIAAAAMPAALLALLFAGTGLTGLALFAALFGAGNGAMTVVRGALPVEIYGRDNYGAIAGALAAPGLVARAVGPTLAALLWAGLEGYDGAVVVLVAVAAAGALAFAVGTRPGGRAPGSG
jgi:MFS family permease